MNCFGIDALSGAGIEVEFEETIHSVSAVSSPPDVHLAPGWIDIQVNGFAGVDFNDPRAPHEEIARAARAQFASGVTRFYPTVITGAPEDMQAALRNLRARKTAAGRRGHRRLPRGGSAHRNRGWSARRASETLGSQTRFRRVPPLAGGHARPCAHRDALTGMARGAALYRAHCGRRGSGIDWTYGGKRGADRRCGCSWCIAFDPPRKWRARGDAEAPKLYLGSACRRPLDGGFHCGWNPPGGLVSQDGVAREGC